MIKKIITLCLVVIFFITIISGCGESTSTAAREVKKKDVWLLGYFRQRYPTRIEVDADGTVREVPLPDPMKEEKLHYALSTDGRHWQPLNDNKPVWDQFIRDSFIQRGPDGLWHMVATGGSRDIDREKFGPSCMHASSVDLVDWQVENYLPLMQDVRNEDGQLARNIWAPEWFYDELTGDIVLLWSSSFEDAGWKKSRLWYARTKDWKTFTKAEVLLDPGYSAIDGTLHKIGGKYYLFHKEEEFGAVTGERRAIRLAVADKLEGPYEIVDGHLNGGQLVPTITEGPSLMRDPKENGWLLLYDYCMSNDFGISWSPDLLQWKVLDDISGPADARHGCVLKLTGEQADRLEKAFTKDKRMKTAGERHREIIRREMMRRQIRRAHENK